MTENTPDYSPFRVSTFSAIERLLCSFLIESLTSTPLGSIIYVSRACMMLPEKDRSKLTIDLEHVKKVFTLAQRLDAVVKNEKGNGTVYHRIDFQSLNYADYLEPWITMDAYEYNIPKEVVGVKKDESINKLSKSEKLVYSCRLMTETGYQHLCADFLLYATPLSQQWAGLLTNMISPDTYTDMMRMYKGAPYHDKN